MDTKVKKWGNSLAIRIPKSFAEETNLKDGTPVDLTIEKNRLIVKPRESPESELEELVNKVSEKNIHKEYSFGSRAGNEEW